MNSKLIELRQKIMPVDTNTSKGIKNTQINIPQKLATINNNYTDFSDRFNELNDFYQHLPKEFKNAMIALKDLHNTPYEFSLSVLLGMANTATQHLYDVESYKYGIKPISLFIMILLGTGGSKSTILNELKGPFVDFQKRMWEALKNEDARYISEDKIYKKKIKQYEKDLEDGLHPSFPEKPHPAETANYINSKFTVNGIIDTLKCQPHASIITAEAGVFFSSHAFQGAKQDNTRSTEMTSSLTLLWDAESLTKVIKDERITIDNRRVNSLLMVQEAVIRDVLNNKLFQEQGFTHRILISQIEPFEKPDMSFDDDVILAEELARNGLKLYLNKLNELLNKRPTMKSDRPFELEPIVIPSTHEAKVYLSDFHNRCKDYGKQNNKLELYEGFSNRLHEHCIRIAATLAAFADNELVEITITEAKAAVDIMDMFIDHRSKLDLGITDTRPDLSQGARVLETWFKSKPNLSISLRDLSRLGPNGFRSISATQRETIVEELLRGHVLVAVKDVASSGREVTKYQLNHD